MTRMGWLRLTRACLLGSAICLSASLQARSALETQASQLPTRILAAHNAERRALGLAPLAWDDRLGNQAAQYAIRLALSRQFAHSDARARGGAGENLWMGTRNAFSLEAMVANWLSERQIFKPGVFPAVSRTGNWHQVGHYTQIVWPATQRVGCALASNAGEDYLVCHYFPAGNVHGTSLRVRPRYAALTKR